MNTARKLNEKEEPKIINTSEKETENKTTPETEEETKLTFRSWLKNNALTIGVTVVTIAAVVGTVFVWKKIYDVVEDGEGSDSSEGEADNVEIYEF